MSSFRDPRLKRLYFRSWHRGTREMDLLLGRFAERHLDLLGEAELDELERLLEAPDPDIFRWVLGEPAPAAFETPLLQLIRDFRISYLDH